MQDDSIDVGLTGLTEVLTATWGVTVDAIVPSMENIQQLTKKLL